MEKIETKAVEKKVVIVTGTSRGLGEALALELDGRGWMVFGCSRTKPAPSAPGARLRWKPCDVTRKEECLRIVSDVVFATGRLDALVNNAGAYSRDLPWMAVTESALNRIMGTNFTGALNMVQCAFSHFAAQQSGHVLNITSSITRKASIKGRGLYAASKAALDPLTRSLAEEFRPINTRVNAVCPGLLRTGMIRHGSEPFEVTPLIADLLNEPDTGQFFRVRDNVLELLEDA